MKRKNSASRNQRVQAGVRLSLAEEPDVKTFNPYDLKPRGQKAKAPKAAEPPTRTDLRKLSEWIKLKREVDALKKDEPDEVTGS